MNRSNMMAWVGRVVRDVLLGIWYPFRIFFKLVWYCLRGQTKAGNVARQTLGVALLTILALIYVYPQPLNILVESSNQLTSQLAAWEALPFKSRGLDQWLAKATIPALPKNTFNLGLDLQGGVRVVYDVDTAKVAEADRAQALISLQKVVTQRVDAFGVSEPRIYLEEGDSTRLIVELAGLQDPEQAIQRIGQTPQLEFYQGRTAAESQAIIDELTSGGASEFRNPYFQDNPVLTGGNLDKAEVVFDPQTAQPQVAVSFDTEGKQKFAEFTKNNIGSILYIVLDGQVVSAPRINQEIPNGQAIISGDFTANTAKELVDYLNSGALPLPISIVAQQRVEASLGTESLAQSIRAGGFGLLFIAVFMLIFYRALGLIAILSLVVYTVLVLAIFNLLGFTLTIAGITGFIVSIGLAVDGNILIFERMKEELASGKNFEASTKEGFKRAWQSIRDSQISTLISALILFYLASGVVQGFGITLTIGILVSLFTAITVSRLFITILGYQDWLLRTRFGKFISLQK